MPNASEKQTKKEVQFQGRRNDQAAANSLQFLAEVEGVEVELLDGTVIRGNNGMKWRLA